MQHIALDTDSASTATSPPVYSLTQVWNPKNYNDKTYKQPIKFLIFSASLVTDVCVKQAADAQIFIWNCLQCLKTCLLIPSEPVLCPSNRRSSRTNTTTKSWLLYLCHVPPFQLWCCHKLVGLATSDHQESSPWLTQASTSLAIMWKLLCKNVCLWW